jgi:hypothetical protein
VTEPTTPTGKRLVTWQTDEEDGTLYRPFATADDILAIEREATAQERERLRKAVAAIKPGCHSHSGLSCEEDEYGWCYLIDRGEVLSLLEDEVGTE